MLLAIASVLGIMWLVGFTLFHSSSAIHVLLLVAVAVLVAHLVQVRRVPGRV